MSVAVAFAALLHCCIVAVVAVAVNRCCCFCGRSSCHVHCLVNVVVNACL